MCEGNDSERKRASQVSLVIDDVVAPVGILPLGEDGIALIVVRPEAVLPFHQVDEAVHASGCSRRVRGNFDSDRVGFRVVRGRNELSENEIRVQLVNDRYHATGGEIEEGGQHGRAGEQSAIGRSSEEIKKLLGRWVS